jgi:hypothetical protein
VFERAAQGAEPKRLADDAGVQDHAHDQRLIARGLTHLVELIDDHIGEVRGAHLTADFAMNSTSLEKPAPASHLRDNRPERWIHGFFATTFPFSQT